MSDPFFDLSCLVLSCLVLWSVCPVLSCLVLPGVFLSVLRVFTRGTHNSSMKEAEGPVLEEREEEAGTTSVCAERRQKKCPGASPPVSTRPGTEDHPDLPPPP